MHFSLYHSMVRGKSYAYFSESWSRKCCACIVTHKVSPLHSNAEISPTYLDHFTDQVQLLTPTMTWYGLKCIWKWIKSPCLWHALNPLIITSRIQSFLLTQFVHWQCKRWVCNDLAIKGDLNMSPLKGTDYHDIYFYQNVPLLVQ